MVTKLSEFSLEEKSPADRFIDEAGKLLILFLLVMMGILVFFVPIHQVGFAASSPYLAALVGMFTLLIGIWIRYELGTTAHDRAEIRAAQSALSAVALELEAALRIAEDFDVKKRSLGERSLRTAIVRRAASLITDRMFTASRDRLFSITFDAERDDCRQAISDFYAYLPHARIALADQCHRHEDVIASDAAQHAFEEFAEVRARAAKGLAAIADLLEWCAAYYRQR